MSNGTVQHRLHWTWLLVIFLGVAISTPSEPDWYQIGGGQIVTVLGCCGLLWRGNIAVPFAVSGACAGILSIPSAESPAVIVLIVTIGAAGGLATGCDVASRRHMYVSRQERKPSP